MSSSDLGTGLTDPDSFFSRIFHYNDNDDYYNDGVDKESKAKMPPYHRAEVGMEARGQIDRNQSSVGKDPGRSPGGPGRHNNEDLHDYIIIIMIMIMTMINIKLSSVWLLIVTLKMTYSGAPVISIPSKILKSHLGKSHHNHM